MTEGNLEVVRSLYEAMEARDLEAGARLTHPDAVWVPDRRVGQEPVRGRENVIRFFTERADMFGEIHTEVERLEAVDDTVLAFIRVSGRGEASGAGFDIRIGHLWTLRDGVVVRGEGYGDRGAALEAAGLSD
jgi:uncharacterized protein